MRKLLFISFLMTGCITSPEAKVNYWRQMECAQVSDDISRCENSEVVCYSSEGASSCLFKGVPK